MRGIAIQARGLESAQRLYEALIDFGPNLVGNERDGFQVVVDVNGDRRIVAVLAVLQRYVSGEEEAARVELAGRSYTVHPEGTPAATADESLH